jgi:ribosome-associated protein
MHDRDEEFFEEGPSKTALKKEMLARQALGETLCSLSPKELARIPIPTDALANAIEQAHSIHSRSARRRHMQFIGKLMRDIDPAPIQAALDALHEQRRGDAAAFQELEQMRDALLAKGDKALGPVLDRWPQADRQHLRQLLLQARREQDRDQPPSAARKLFRYLRELRDGEQA